jgi:hypothetical protein
MPYTYLATIFFIILTGLKGYYLKVYLWVEFENICRIWLEIQYIVSYRGYKAYFLKTTNWRNWRERPERPERRRKNKRLPYPSAYLVYSNPVKIPSNSWLSCNSDRFTILPTTNLHACPLGIRSFSKLSASLFMRLPIRQVPHVCVHNPYPRISQHTFFIPPN